jgi:hypothetical protein
MFNDFCFPAKNDVERLFGDYHPCQDFQKLALNRPKLT